LFENDENVYTNYIQTTVSESTELDTVVEIPEEIWLSNNEANNRAIVDTGCAKSVAGSKWIENLILTMDQEDLNYV